MKVQNPNLKTPLEIIISSTYIILGFTRCCSTLYRVLLRAHEFSFSVTFLNRPDAFFDASPVLLMISMNDM